MLYIAIKGRMQRIAPGVEELNFDYLIGILIELTLAFISLRCTNGAPTSEESVGHLLSTKLGERVKDLLAVDMLSFNHYPHHARKHLGIMRHKRPSGNFVDPMNLGRTILLQNRCNNLSDST